MTVHPQKTLEEGMNYRLLTSPQKVITLLSSEANDFGVTCAIYKTHYKIDDAPKLRIQLVYILSGLPLASIKPQIALYHH